MSWKILLVTFITSAFVYASYAPKDYSITPANEWRSVNGLFGMSESFLGPQKEGDRRPVITVSPVAHKDFPIEFFKEHEYFLTYQKEKKLWVNKRNGEILEFIQSSNSMGVSYTMDDKSFFEKSYYISCPAGLYAIKYLTPLSSKSDFEEDVSKMIESFQCHSS